MCNVFLFKGWDSSEVPKKSLLNYWTYKYNTLSFYVKKKLNKRYFRCPIKNVCLQNIFLWNSWCIYHVKRQFSPWHDSAISVTFIFILNHFSQNYLNMKLNKHRILCVCVGLEIFIFYRVYCQDALVPSSEVVL
jgi:hypothetical protein